MIARAVEKARARLNATEKAIEGMKQAEDFSAFEEQWFVFLAAHNSFYNVLDEGSKVAGPAKGWSDKVKHDRKSSVLLNYLRHARNSDDHSIRETTEAVGAIMVSNLGGIDLSFAAKLSRQTNDLAITEPTIQLVTVKDRNGNEFTPPFLPTDQRTHNNCALHAAELCVEQLRQLLAEAERLTT